MGDTSTTFGIDIEETGAGDAASQLEALREKLLADTGALREMQGAMRNLKGGTSVNVEAFKSLRDQIDAQKASIAGAQAQFVALGGAFGTNAAAAKASAAAAAEAAAALRSAKAIAAAALREDAAASAADAAAMKANEAATNAANAAALKSAKATAAAALREDAAAAAADAAALRAETAAQNAAAKAAEKDAAALEKEAAASAKAAKATTGVGDSAGVTEGQMHALVSSAQVAGGSFGGLAGRAQQLITGLSKGGLAGAAILAAAAVALLVVGVISATIAIAQWAIGLADARRNQELATAGVAASNKELAGLAGILPSVQAATGLATDQLTQLAESLATAGVKAKDMPTALRAIAMATAGGATSEFLEKLKKDLASGEKSAKDLAKTVEQKFGGIVAKKLLSLDAQAAKLKQNLAGTFGGLKIEGLLTQLATLVALFDQNTATGRTLKAVFEAIFQPLIDGAAAAIPAIRTAFITVLTYGLKAYVALKPFSAELKLLGLAVLLVAGVIVTVFVGSILAVIATVAAVAGVIAAAVAATLWLGESIVDALGAAVDWLSSLSLSDIGGNLMGGLASGIAAGAGAVLAAITGAVSGAIGAAKSLLGIASDSKVFMKIGGHTAGGMTTGLEKGTGDVVAAAGAMAGGATQAANDSAAASGPSGGAARSSGPITINITVNASGGEDIAAVCKRSVAEALEEAGLGAGVAEAA